MSHDVIQDAIQSLTKTFGAGVVTKLTAEPNVYVPHISTGIYSLDKKVLGIGGVPTGRIIEVFGPEASGKSTLALQIVAAAQGQGKNAAYIDVEHALDPNWMLKMKVDVNNLLVSQPDYGEQALQIVEGLIDTNAFGIIVVDSVSALVPKAELDGEIGDAVVGLQARLMSQAMRKLNAKVSKSEVILLFINQIREKIGVMFGNPETTTGGRALKFYSSVRLDVRRIGSIKSGEEIVGNKVRIKCAKNKVAAPFRDTEIDLMFDKGFDVLGDLVENAVAAGIIEKSGSWFSYQGTKLGQGKAAAVKCLWEDAELESEVRKCLK